MKHKITLTIALVLSIVILSLIAFDLTATAQQRKQARFDTGMMTIGHGQILRLSISGDGVDQDDVIQVRFRRLGYIEQDNLYRVTAQTLSGPVAVTPLEAVSTDIRLGEFDAVRGIVNANYIGTNASRARVTVQIIEEATGEVQSVLIALLIP